MNIFITGGVGCGKSTFVSYLKKYINSDYIFRDLDSEAKEIINEHNIPIPKNKTSLFENQNDLLNLEKTVLKYISPPNKNSIIEASTILECPIIYDKNDLIINIQSNKSQRNVLSRDNIDRESLIKSHQLHYVVKEIISDVTIQNNSDLNFLETKAKLIAENLNYQTTQEYKNEILYLEQEWIRSFPDLPRKLLDTIIKNYSKPTRFYHNLSHLVYLVKHFNFYFRETIKHKLWKRAILLSIFYHDVYMDFKPISENEENSIKLMFHEFYNLNLFNKTLIGSRSYLSLAADLIYCSKNHTTNEYISNSEFGKTYANMFLDLDLLVLADKDTYAKFEENIRKEWIDFSNEIYNKGRIGVLEKLKQQPIFKSDILKDKNKIAEELINKRIKELENETNY